MPAKKITPKSNSNSNTPQEAPKMKISSIIMVVFSVIIVLSMVLSAFITN